MVGEKKGCAVTRLLHRMTGSMRAKQGEAGGRKGQEPSCLCYKSTSLYHLVSWWPRLSCGKHLLSKQLAMAPIFQQWLV